MVILSRRTRSWPPAGRVSWSRRGNLPIQIRAIRRVLDYGRAQGSCIQTVAGRGYRFIEPLTTADTNAPLDPDPDTPSLGWPSPAERRPVTVLSAEIAGFSASASEAEPEVMLEPSAPLCRHCVEIIGQYDGFVANLSGEAVIAYFGYPAAHEDDAERAVRGGLALVDAVTHFEPPNRLQVHIGIATGLVVIVM
jgi:class 3 adenylate cyclase